MKPAQQWHDELLTEMNRPSSFHFCDVDVADIRRIQADAMRHAAEAISSMKISDTTWEDSERVVTLNGEPIGGTVDRPESYRWGTALCKRMAELLTEEADKLEKA